ncbi:GntR family transcriptional regulator [Roseomonas elaeocarpi]|uniref:GntR family transcriptional regulator n=1 Tax=Roseomonas elaeocarpi TaxID=907779 RepID=A0ABV6JZK6_9PROT
MRSDIRERGTFVAAPLRSGRPATAALQLHQLIRGRIVSGHYPPLQTLSEKELAQDFGVSRTPVREALSKLEEEGLVSIQPQRGTLVSPISTARIRSSQFVREALECAAVGLGAALRTPAQVTELRLLLDRQRLCDSEAEFLAADEALHQQLMALAGQAAAWTVVEMARIHLDRIRYLSVQRPSKRQSVLEEHARIIDRISAGDAAGATEAMRHHLRGVFVSTEEVMRDHPTLFEDAPDSFRPLRRRSRPAAAGGAQEPSQPQSAAPP